MLCDAILRIIPRRGDLHLHRPCIAASARKIFQFLKAVLPDPGDLGRSTKGRTCIGNIVRGTQGGAGKSLYVYNACDHEQCFAEVGSQAISYTTGVPAMIGAKLMLDQAESWLRPGVWNIEQNDPDPFMSLLNEHGLPWQVAGDVPEIS